LSEGSGTTGMRVFTPHPIFPLRRTGSLASFFGGFLCLTLVPRIEKYPSPARGEGQTLDILMLAMVKIISDSSADSKEVKAKHGLGDRAGWLLLN